MDTKQMRMRTRLLRAAAAAVPAALIVAMLGTSAASAKPRYFAASNETACLANHNVNGFLRRNHANVLRLIVSPSDARAGAGVKCVEHAHAAAQRYRVALRGLTADVDIRARQLGWRQLKLWWRKQQLVG